MVTRGATLLGNKKIGGSTLLRLRKRSILRLQQIGTTHMNSCIKTILLCTAIMLSALFAAPVHSQTGQLHVSGHISNVTFTGDYVMIMVDAGLPGNCAGTSWGWMKIPPENKAMNAFVIGLWMRGDAASTTVTVYTDGIPDGYCRITQIDPVG
jgi:hypothetical protein